MYFQPRKVELVRCKHTKHIFFYKLDTHLLLSRIRVESVLNTPCKFIPKEKKRIANFSAFV